MAFDLTPRVAPFLDKHLVFPLLEFIQEARVYPEDDILKAKLDILGKTNMVDYAMDIHKCLFQDQEPQELLARRAEVVRNYNSLVEAASPLLKFLQDPALVQELRQDKQYNLQMLEQKHQITEKHIESLYDYAKFRFECGAYSEASEYLYNYRTLAQNPDRLMGAMWGKLAAEILTQNWDAAMDELNKMKDLIDSKSFSSPLEQLQQRTWLLHWSLFIFYNTESGKNNLIELFMQEKYLNAIQTNAQHLLRYLCQAVLTSKRRRNLIKDLVRVLTQEAHVYHDPITEFVDSLFVKADLSQAEEKLKECKQVLCSDFFLGKESGEGSTVVRPFLDEFMETGRVLIFETYCRIHQVIDIKMLSEKLSLSLEEAEKWIMNLIRGAKLEAKIDSKAGTVLMLQQYPSAYESIIEKSKNLAARTYQLHSNILSIASPIQQ